MKKLKLVMKLRAVIILSYILHFVRSWTYDAADFCYSEHASIPRSWQLSQAEDTSNSPYSWILGRSLAVAENIKTIVALKVTYFTDEN